MMAAFPPAKPILYLVVSQAVVLMLLPTAADKEPRTPAAESVPVPPRQSDERPPQQFDVTRSPPLPRADPPWPPEKRPQQPLNNDTGIALPSGRYQQQLPDEPPAAELPRGALPAAASAMNGIPGSHDGWLARLPAVSFVASKLPPPDAALLDPDADAALPPSLTSPPAASEVRLAEICHAHRGAPRCQDPVMIP